MSGRNILLSVIVIMLLLIGLSFQFHGYEATWQIWNIPTLMPPFTDLRLLPGSAESFRAGYNPIYENPGDPLGRHFNYPFAWYFVFYTGIKQEDTISIGILFALGYLFFAWIFPRRIGLPEACFFALILFSPASMLCLERGNVDLFIFILCASALIVLENSLWLSAAILIIASLLKLFPIFGFAVFLREPRFRFWTFSLCGLSILLIYAVLTYPNIFASFAYTEKGGELSYGVNVIPLYASLLFKSKRLFDLLTPVFSLIGLGLFLFALYRSAGMPGLSASESRHLAGFRLGAVIYAGTFFIGNNWDYRLIFLLFVIPQLIEWTNDPSVRNVSQWTLIALLVSCWYLVNLRLLGFIPFGAHIVYALDQISKWGLFTGLTYLFFASLPDWFRSELFTVFRFRRQRIP